MMMISLMTMLILAFIGQSYGKYRGAYGKKCRSACRKARIEQEDNRQLKRLVKISSEIAYNCNEKINALELAVILSEFKDSPSSIAFRLASISNNDLPTLSTSYNSQEIDNDMSSCSYNVVKAFMEKEALTIEENWTHFCKFILFLSIPILFLFSCHCYANAAGYGKYK